LKVREICNNKLYDYVIKTTGIFQGGDMNPILVVDDEAYLRDLYIDEFTDAGFNVRSAASGNEALELVKKERPQVIILDIMLPDISGLRVLEEIKTYDKTIPIILHSAYTVYKADFSSWMADDYVVKTSDISELINKVKTLAGPAKTRPSLVAT
jgi:DNA-binding response OmpR family regulator